MMTACQALLHARSLSPCEMNTHPHFTDVKSALGEGNLPKVTQLVSDLLDLTLRPTGGLSQVVVLTTPFSVFEDVNWW